MNHPLIMTPGPTSVHEEVRKALSNPITNPDLDLNFYEFYKQTCKRVQDLFHTKNQALILSGEAILGLEAACASLIEPGDRVLCIDNGIFGNGFGDFAKTYGAKVAYFQSDYRRAIDVGKLEEFLKENHDFKVATLVHCETPSGITNPIELICPLLKKYNIITVVDSVSAVGGEELETDKWMVDILLGGTQKCLSAPPGLTILSISEEAFDKMLNRNTPIPSFYCNLAKWKNWYEEKSFPYTQAISNIYGLKVALDRLLGDESRLERHKRIGKAVRESLIEGGLELYPLDGFSNTVTSINIPSEISFKDIFNSMLKDHNIMIAGAFGVLKDKVIRIGHMGENCYEEKIYITLKALDRVLRKYDVKLQGELHKLFTSFI